MFRGRKCGQREKKHNIAHKSLVRPKRRANLPNSWDTSWIEVQHCWKWQSKKRYQWFKEKWKKEIVSYFTWTKEEAEVQALLMLDDGSFIPIEEDEHDKYIRIRGQRK